jgi:RNA polymerase-binding transcription factor DksA
MKKPKKTIKAVKHKKVSKTASHARKAKSVKKTNAKKTKTRKPAKPAKGAKKNKTSKSSKSKVLCEFCGSAIPAERLEILPETTTCVQCSQEQPYSQAEIMGLDGTDEQDKNRLNVEDFDEPDTDISLPYNESW